jgi:mannitol-1-/sugar-/sorbitol-6-phosphatase
VVTTTCRGLLVDMDGVLVDSTAAVARVWTRWALAHNLDPEYCVQFAHGRKAFDSLQGLLPDADHGTLLADNQWLERAEIEDIADVIALPGAKDLLTGVSPGQIAVVTSATRQLAEVRLRAAALWDHVHAIVTADDIRRGKPDPEPYQKGAAALNLPSSDCVVIEDAPAGTRAGKAAGSRVIAVRTTTPDQELLVAGADWVVNDCSAVRAANHTKAHTVTIELATDAARREPKMR